VKAALLQLNSGDCPAENLVWTTALIEEAAASGAEFIATPEVTNCVSVSRARQMDVLRAEVDDITLKTLREVAANLEINLLIGSLALKTADADGRFANRSFMIDRGGRITARYDKIHMFDATLSEEETYQESRGYRPGSSAILARADDLSIGMSICYDVRFPHLYRMLAQAGADVLIVPSAFAVATGQAHWEMLLRARAIETGCYVLAPAQWGAHEGRDTYGHTLAVDPWGTLLSDFGEGVGISYIEIDKNQVLKARKRVPAWGHNQLFEGP
jgi:predicted amidohydrolase